jgi:hypothetical protein
VTGDEDAPAVGARPSWLRPHRGESRLPVAAAVLCLVALQLAIPRNLAFQPWWLLPGLEIALFVVLSIADPARVSRDSAILRMLSLGLVAIASVGTIYSAARLVDRLIFAGIAQDAKTILLNGGAIWLTNVIVFGLWFWEGDRGGPAARATGRRQHPDFLFPQMTAPELTRHDWHPAFVDYFYLSFTNATAFSPTDTMPLHPWAKLTMLAESATSLVIVLLVVARAINVLH